MWKLVSLILLMMFVHMAQASCALPNDAQTWKTHENHQCGTLQITTEGQFDDTHLGGFSVLSLTFSHKHSVVAHVVERFENEAENELPSVYTGYIDGSCRKIEGSRRAGLRLMVLAVAESGGLDALRNLQTCRNERGYLLEVIETALEDPSNFEESLRESVQDYLVPLD